jgi:hypothetical protein
MVCKCIFIELLSHLIHDLPLLCYAGSFNQFHGVTLIYIIWDGNISLNIHLCWLQQQYYCLAFSIRIYIIPYASIVYCLGFHLW